MEDNLIKIKHITYSEDELKEIKKSLNFNLKYYIVSEKIKEAYKEEFKNNYKKVFEYLIENKEGDNYMKRNMDANINSIMRPIYKILNAIDSELKLWHKFLIKYNNNLFFFETYENNMLNKIKYIGNMDENTISKYSDEGIYYISIENILDYLND